MYNPYKLLERPDPLFPDRRTPDNLYHHWYERYFSMEFITLNKSNVLAPDLGTESLSIIIQGAFDGLGDRTDFTSTQKDHIRDMFFESIKIQYFWAYAPLVKAFPLPNK